MTPIVFWGKVRKGKNRGKKLGFPTANIALHKKIPEGVYISKTSVKGVWYPSLAFIGAAKTFDEHKVQAESYILFSLTPERWKARLSDFYGQWITMKLLKKIRGNQRFATAGELVNQMKEDEKEAKRYFADSASFL